MANLDLASVNERLRFPDKQFAIRIGTNAELDKYPAKQHARAVALRLGVETGLIYLQGAPTTFLEDSDQDAPFRQRRYFYYLSGSDEADNHLLYDISRDKLTLFIPKIDLHKAVWGGAGSSKAEAESKYDADAIAYVSELEHAVKKWWTTTDGKLYLLHPLHDTAFIEASSPRVDVTTLQTAADRCRVVKDDYEIGLIRKANDVSASAHRAVLENIRSFKNEAQVEGLFLNTCVSASAHNQAYNIIAGSGSNAAVLHYVKNDEPLKGRQVLLIDAGAEWKCYASDVTRTFPISGYWTEEAKSIYDLVSQMQADCITRIAPGVHYRDLQVLAHVIAAKGLLKLGILHNGSVAEILKAGTTLAFFPHGLGHHVGLEVHDVLNVPIQMDQVDRFQNAKQNAKGKNMFGMNNCIAEEFQQELQGVDITSLYSTLINPAICMAPLHVEGPELREGMVITVEPGIYFSAFALERNFLLDPVHAKFINKQVLKNYMPVGGVRIEDDILVTKKSYENLTTAPKGEEALRIIRGEEKETEKEESPAPVTWGLIHEFDSHPASSYDGYQCDTTSTFERPKRLRQCPVVSLDGPNKKLRGRPPVNRYVCDEAHDLVWEESLEMPVYDGHVSKSPKQIIPYTPTPYTPLQNDTTEGFINSPAWYPKHSTKKSFDDKVVNFAERNRARRARKQREAAAFDEMTPPAQHDMFPPMMPTSLMSGFPSFSTGPRLPSMVTPATKRSSGRIPISSLLDSPTESLGKEKDKEILTPGLSQDSRGPAMQSLSKSLCPVPNCFQSFLRKDNLRAHIQLHAQRSIDNGPITESNDIKEMMWRLNEIHRQERPDDEDEDDRSIKKFDEIMNKGEEAEGQGKENNVPKESVVGDADPVEPDNALQDYQREMMLIEESDEKQTEIKDDYLTSQDYQMQLMLLEQQNKKRLIKTANQFQVQDEFNCISTGYSQGINNEQAINDYQSQLMLLEQRKPRKLKMHDQRVHVQIGPESWRECKFPEDM